MTDIDGALAPPGTRLAPRQNLDDASRGLSVAAGAALGLLAARRTGVTSVALGLAASLLVARGLTGASPTTRLLGQRPDEDEVAEATGWSSAALLSRAVTINASRAEVWAQFSDLSTWPRWSDNVEQIEGSDDPANPHLRFVTHDPSGTVTWDGKITERRENEVLSLASLPGSAVPIVARYELRDAPGGRGTEIHGALAYEPPGGSLARYAAKLTQKEPGIQMRRDLKRFKMLIETGEIATNAPQSTKLTS
jgi:uncharacterized membrane protein